MSRAPRITVFMPVRDRERYVAEAIDSVLAQTFADFELLVIDDASTDGTLDVVTRYRDPRLRLVRNEKNLGIPAVRNQGLDLARGELLALLDSDDIAKPERLTRQVAFLDAHSDHALVGSWARKLDKRGRLRDVLRRPLTWQRIRSRLLFMGTLRTPSVMGRLEVLRSYRFSEDFPVCSDTDYWMRIALEHRCANLPEPLICYRKHPGGVTKSNRELTRDRKLAVTAYQLDRLGVRYSRADLNNHWGLRKGSPGEMITPDFMRWARDWLLGLLAANRRCSLFPEPCFTHAVGERWYLLHARDAQTSHSGGVRLFDPALRAQVAAYLGRRFALQLRYGAGIA